MSDFFDLGIITNMMNTAVMASSQSALDSTFDDRRDTKPSVDAPRAERQLRDESGLDPATLAALDMLGAEIEDERAAAQHTASKSMGCVCPGDATPYCRNPLCPRKNPSETL